MEKVQENRKRKYENHVIPLSSYSVQYYKKHNGNTCCITNLTYLMLNWYPSRIFSRVSASYFCFLSFYLFFSFDWPDITISFVAINKPPLQVQHNTSSLFCFTWSLLQYHAFDDVTTEANIAAIYQQQRRQQHASSTKQQ